MSRPRILIVDDEPAMLRAVGRILEGTYEIIGAPTPAEALAIAPTFEPDLAVVDIRMPEMDGFELMKRLGALVPGIDLIVMTGSATEADAKLIRAIREGAFYFIQKPFDREVMVTLVARCLELRRLEEENRRHVARLEGELHEARAFQESLLPRTEARIEGVAIAARYVSCSELGGDFFDYASGARGRATVLIADVSGHGASAAMLTGIVKAAFHSERGDGYEPRAVVSRIQAGLGALADNMMVTAFCARFDREERTLQYVGAGHPPAILRRGDGALERLAPTGSLISPAFPGARWEQARTAFGHDDLLVLYTDGAVEAQGESGEFGFEGLARIVIAKGAGGGGDGDLLDAVLDEIRGFMGGRPAEDDITLLLARFASERKRPAKT